MKARICIAVALLVAATLGTEGCGDLTGLGANLPVFEDTVVVFALSGTPASAPVAINTAQARAVRAETGSGFDVLFDITPEGQAEIIPPSILGLTARTGVLESTMPFDAIDRAPASGYVESATTPIDVGDVVVIRAAAVSCGGQVNPFIYSKLEILDVDAAARSIRVRLRVDRNCGFRSFGEGVPKD